MKFDFPHYPMKTHQRLILLHVDTRLCVYCGVDVAHERVGDQRLLLIGVVRVVVVCYKAAEAGSGDVPGEVASVLLLITRVTRGGRERQREVEQEEEGQ